MNRWLRMLLCLMLAVPLVQTVGAARSEAYSSAVNPINWGSFAAGNPADSDSVRVETILLNATKYNLNTWYTSRYGTDTGYLILGGTGESAIRPPASVAFSTAVAIKTGVYDSGVVGLSEAAGKERAMAIVKSVAKQHKTSTAGGWGDAWQSAMWAALNGFAGWMLWDDLSAPDREYVRLMVEYEANRFLTGAPVVGTAAVPGTAGEENAWNAMVLQLATAMMPDHAHYEAWMNQNLRYMMNAYARPSDLSNDAYINGKKVSQWVEGINLYENGMVVNHNRIHPDYMTTVGSNLHSVYPYSLAGVSTPQAALFNADVIYGALVDLAFVEGDDELYPPGGAIQAPGGTIYIDGEGSLYYPQGGDWGPGRRMHVALFDIQARHLGLDAAASERAEVWEDLHAQAALAMQNRFTDGRTYAGSGEDSYAGREQWVHLLAGRAYLMKWLVHQDAVRISNDAYFTVLDPSNVAAHKSVAYSDQETGNPALNLVNERWDDRWSAPGYPQWAEIDLGEAISIGSVDVFPYGDRAYRYKIEASPDGVSYSTVVDRLSNTESASQLHDAFAAVTARYVRLTVSGAYGYAGGWVSLHEFSVYGSGHNLALTGTAAVSAHQSGYPAANVIDDDTGNESRWSHNGFNQWVEIDLGRARSFSRIEVVPYDSRPYRYKVEVSADGLTYAQVVDRLQNTESSAVLADTFSTAEARYVRMTVAGADSSQYTGSYISIKEFRVIN